MGCAMAATVETSDARGRASRAPEAKRRSCAKRCSRVPTWSRFSLAEGAEAAVARALAATGDDLAAELRRRRHGLALTRRARRPCRRIRPRTSHRLAVRFRRRRDRPGALLAPSPNGFRMPSRPGFAVIALGQAWQPRAQLLVRRRSGPALRSRDDAAPGARRRRRGRGADRPPPDRAAPATHRRRLCRARRPAAAAFARSDSDRRCRSARRSLIMNRPPCRGSGPPSSAPGRAAATARSARAFWMRSNRSSGAARSISA